jgi:hypothetical protein
MKIVEEAPFRFRIEREGAMRVPGVVFVSRDGLTACPVGPKVRPEAHQTFGSPGPRDPAAKVTDLIRRWDSCLGRAGTFASGDAPGLRAAW